jgi:hypothetical protein
VRSRRRKLLRAELAGEILGVPPGAVADVLDCMLADPWLTPAAAVDSINRGAAPRRRRRRVPRVRRTVSAPPRVIAAGGSIFVTTATATWRLICDCFGRLLMRHDLPSSRDPPPPRCRVAADGVVQWGAGRASFPQWAGDVAGFACDGHTSR